MTCNMKHIYHDVSVFHFYDFHQKCPIVYAYNNISPLLLGLICEKREKKEKDKVFPWQHASRDAILNVIV